MAVIKRRAMHDDQKLIRRQALIDAAWGLFQTQSYAAINMNEVAQTAEVAKGTVYLYFPSKESLFLAVLETQFTLWFDAIDSALVTPNLGITEVAELFTESFTQHRGLARLFAITHVILEHNIDYEVARQFKTLLYQRITYTGRLLEMALPILTPKSGVQILLRAYALVIGIQHLADPAPIMLQVIADHPELHAFQIEFASLFFATFNALLQGSNLYE
jgi:AcrR family transcriptional regulator